MSRSDEALQRVADGALSEPPQLAAVCHEHTVATLAHEIGSTPRLVWFGTDCRFCRIRVAFLPLNTS